MSTYNNGKTASDYQMSDSHESRIQRLEEVGQDTATQVAQYGVKIDMLGEMLGNKLEAVSERLGEKLDATSKKVDDLTPLVDRVGSLEKAEAKRLERASILKKGAVGVFFAGLGALAKTVFPWLSNLF